MPFLFFIPADHNLSLSLSLSLSLFLWMKVCMYVSCVFLSMFVRIWDYACVLYANLFEYVCVWQEVTQGPFLCGV